MVQVILTHTNHRMTEKNLGQMDEIELDAFIGTLIGSLSSNQRAFEWIMVNKFLLTYFYLYRYNVKESFHWNIS